MTCKRTATTLTGDLGIVLDDPNIALVHPITQTHACTGRHTSIAGLAIHHCDCGATFYILAEAMNTLVTLSPALDELVKKAIREGNTEKVIRGNDSSQE